MLQIINKLRDIYSPRDRGEGHEIFEESQVISIVTGGEAEGAAR